MKKKREGKITECTRAIYKVKRKLNLIDCFKFENCLLSFFGFGVSRTSCRLPLGPPPLPPSRITGSAPASTAPVKGKILDLSLIS